MAPAPTFSSPALGLSLGLPSPACRYCWTDAPPVVMHQACPRHLPAEVEATVYGRMVAFAVLMAGVVGSCSCSSAAAAAVRADLGEWAAVYARVAASFALELVGRE